MGVSVPMQRIYSSIQRASSHRYPVLIVGESGTGKELVARCIHSVGLLRSAHRPAFVPVDCTALAPPLMEPELFGYAKDAFIGTPEAKKGLVRLAEDGTLFLREIADLPLKLQAKLFHALQEQEFSPVGSTERFSFRARVMAATQRNLGELVAKGAFREDLYFHLSAVRIELPPLRARRPDIPLLASHFLEKYSERGQPSAAFPTLRWSACWPIPGRATCSSWNGPSGGRSRLLRPRWSRWTTCRPSCGRRRAAGCATPPRGFPPCSPSISPSSRHSTRLAVTGRRPRNLLHIAESALESKLQNYGFSTREPASSDQNLEILRGCGSRCARFVRPDSSLSWRPLTGDIRGVVLDPQGLPVAAAQVTVRNLETGASRSVADGFGRGLRGATTGRRKLQVRVEKQGFLAFVTTVAVRSGEVAEANASLQVGSVNQSVTVAAGARTYLDVASAQVATSLDATTIQDIPSLDRDPVALTSLVSRHRAGQQRQSLPAVGKLQRQRPARPRQRHHD